MSKRTHRTPPFRFIRCCLIAGQLGLGAANPLPAAAPPEVLPAVAEIPVAFSADPGDEELSRAHVFDEPLVPLTGRADPRENRALARALLSYAQARQPEAVRPLVEFLADHPGSRWRASVQTNLGLLYRRTGYFTRALEAWEDAWAQSKGE